MEFENVHNMTMPTTKSTLISVVPFAIYEQKPGLIPSDYHIDACPDNEVVCTLVDQAIHHVYIDKDRGSMRVINPSYEVARAIVADYLSAQLEAAPFCHPGVTWKLGEWTPKLLKEKCPEEIEELRRIQNTWFMAIVRLGDDDWEKTRQHYAISDTQRIAAKKLDPKNSRQRPWIMINPSDTVAGQVEMTLCPACGSDIPKSVVICRYCSFVLDPERHKAMTFAGSGVSGVPQIDLSKVRM